MVRTRGQARAEVEIADEQQDLQAHAHRQMEELRFRRLANSVREATEEHPAAHHLMRFVRLLHREQLDSSLFLWIALLIIDEAVIRLAPTLGMLRTLSTLTYVYMPYSVLFASVYMYFVPMRQIVDRLVVDVDVAVKLVLFAISGNLIWASVYGAYCLTVWLQVYKLPQDEEAPGFMLCPGVVPFDGMAWNETAGCWGAQPETGLMEV